MTEEEWLCSDEPQPMIEFLHSSASDRRLRLFTSVICRRWWSLIVDASCRRAIEASEMFADGQITELELDLCSAGAEEVYEELASEPLNDQHFESIEIAHAVSYATSPSLGLEVVLEVIDTIQGIAQYEPANELYVQSCFLRDIFGNPFRPVTFDPAWRTSTAVGVAETIYADRTFDNLPILADALQDAGCDHPDILTHLRGPGPHVRGCWALDLVLGKA